MWEWFVKYWLQVLFGLITGGLSLGFAWLNKRYKQNLVKEKAIEAGLRVLLFVRLDEMHQQHVCEGYILSRDLKSVEKVYTAYKGLNGNDTGDELYAEIKGLTHNPPNKKGASN